MAVYKWQGVSPRGEALKGEMEATSREAVIIRLRSQRIQPKANSIREKGNLARVLAGEGVQTIVREEG